MPLHATSKWSGFRYKVARINCVPQCYATYVDPRTYGTIKLQLFCRIPGD